ncbi:MAG: AAA family ATPase [Immundisolibacteraceae bacterium]|nr:AAA family ATPase [Immundisolibacteraceae bacterium]
MYKTYFGLQERPFSITPDPRFLYPSPQHQEALGHLQYGIGENSGFALLTGEVGTGKTTVIRALIDQLPSDINIASITNPQLSADELVASICDEFGVVYPPNTRSLKTLIDLLNHFLIEHHKIGNQSVVIIDEAQNLSRESLEQIRLLTNLETHEQKLLRIILVGQPELRDLLMRHDLRQLAQRITARCHLGMLNAEQTQAYIGHRLAVAGANTNLFSSAAVRTVFKLTGGIPRLVNALCDRALLGAYSEEATAITPKIVRRASHELFTGTKHNPWPRALALAIPVSLLVVVMLGVVWFGDRLTIADQELFTAPIERNAN